MRRGVVFATAAAVAIGAPSVYIMSDELRRRKAFRTVDFWSRTLPRYVHYRVTEVRMKGKSEQEREEAFHALHRKHAPETLQDILHMRGLYIKLGQIMTNRSDYAPAIYQQHYAVLQDAVPARPFSEIRATVEKELGRDLSEVFRSIDEEPLGAATTGQVHGAVLLNGARVVIKVQYPEVEQLFREDLQTVKSFCRLLQPEYLPFLDEMERQFMTEFDYTREGWALDEIGRGVHKEFRNVRIPVPYRELCTRRVCVMERFDGVKLIEGLQRYYEGLARRRGVDLKTLMDQMQREGEASRSRRSPTRLEMQMFRTFVWTKATLYNSVASLWNYTFGWVLPNVSYADTALPLNHVAILDQLFEVHGYEIFQLGTFNGDPHVGNIWLFPNETIGLIDYGQVKQLTTRQRRELAKLIVALCEGTKEDVVNAMIEMGVRTKKMDPFMIEHQARFYYEDDTDERNLITKDGRKLNIQQMMEYFEHEDPLVETPEWTFLVVRCAMLLRGLGSHLGVHCNAAQRWLPAAKRCLKETSWIETIDAMRDAKEEKLQHQ